MKYCSNCGNEIHNEAVVCVHCHCSLYVIKDSRNDNLIGVFSVVGAFLSPMIGVILAVIGLRKYNGANITGKGLCIAGLIVSFFRLVASVIYLILFFPQFGIIN